MHYGSIFGRAALVGLVLAGLALSGCGRRGIPEPPATAGADAVNSALPSDPANPSGGTDEATKPDRPFILDPLVR
jgi:hypothetical protein